MINEQQRRGYLQAMGVECLVPRLSLPGARLSDLGEPDPEPRPGPSLEPATEAPMSAVAPQVTRSQGAAAAVKDLLGNLEGNPRPGAAAAPQTTAPRRAAEPVSAPRFALSVVRAGSMVLLDDGLSPGTDPKRYLSLIQNLLFAIGAGPSEPQVDAFIWPLPKMRGGRVDQSESAAREVLRAYIGKQLEQVSAQYLVAMGETAAQRSGLVSSGSELAYDDGLAVRTLVTTSAIGALSDPAAKSLLWQQLQPLVHAIRATE